MYAFPPSYRDTHGRFTSSVVPPTWNPATAKELTIEPLDPHALISTSYASPFSYGIDGLLAHGEPRLCEKLLEYQIWPNREPPCYRRIKMTKEWLHTQLAHYGKEVDLASATTTELRNVLKGMLINGEV